MSDHMPVSDRPVYIGAYNPMDRDRYVHVTRLDGDTVRGLVASQVQLAAFVEEQRPGTDLSDPDQVQWIDHPGEWTGI